MKRNASFWLAIALPIVVGGCLLPQPDTPPIPPGRASGVTPESARMPNTGGAPMATASASADIGTTVAPSAPSPSPDQGATAAADPAATKAASPSPTPTPTPR